MKVLGWVKAVLAVVLGLVIGLAVTGVVNILHPAENIGWALAAVLVASVLSALAGFIVANPRKKKPAPIVEKDAGAGTPGK
jgi:fructose-specific phosphotransferase system IIC component